MIILIRNRQREDNFSGELCKLHRWRFVSNCIVWFRDLVDTDKEEQSNCERMKTHSLVVTQQLTGNLLRTIIQQIMGDGQHW